MSEVDAAEARILARLADSEALLRDMRMTLKRLAHRAHIRSGRLHSEPDASAVLIADKAIDRIDKFLGHDKRLDILRRK